MGLSVKTCGNYSTALIPDVIRPLRVAKLALARNRRSLDVSNAARRSKEMPPRATTANNDHTQ
jgi:hypothetical protein